MDLSVRDVARLLDVSEDTVYRWARGGTLPAQRVQDQYWFNRVELQEWAALHKHRVSPDLFVSNGAACELPSLHSALLRGGVFHGVPADSREEALAAVSNLPGIPASVDRKLLYQLLVGREVLAPTGIGDGIAIPHARDPLVVRVGEPIVVLCFLRAPVDFHSMDGQPVRVLFTLLSPSVRVHLQMLGKLSFALHDGTMKQLLATEASTEAVIERIRFLEEGVGIADPNQPLAPGVAESLRGRDH